MKCGIVTFHRAVNYGAVLQAYALRKYIIGKFNADCDVIDYRCRSIEDMYIVKGNLLNPKTAIKKIAADRKKRKFEKFIYNFLGIKASVEKSQLKDEGEKYDTVITGSDQVWGKSRIGKDHSYFLDFVKDNDKKVSYAASMGSGTIDPENSDIYESLLSGFKYISVRERQAKETISNLLNRDVEVSIDPTFLLNKQEWKNIAVNSVGNKKYLLIYTLTNSKTIIDTAKKIAAEKGLEIYYITDAFSSVNGIKNLRYLSPCEWVGAFMGASYVVTNSFHGTAFAINFNIDFNTEVSRGLSNRGARIYDLLDSVNMRDRLIDNGSFTSDSIDFSESNDVIESERKRSYLYLNKVLNGGKNDTVR